MRYLSQAIEVKKKRKKPTHQNPEQLQQQPTPNKQNPPVFQCCSIQFNTIYSKLEFGPDKMFHMMWKEAWSLNVRKEHLIYTVFTSSMSEKAAAKVAVLFGTTTSVVRKNNPQHSGLSSCMVPEPQHNLSSELL